MYDNICRYMAEHFSSDIASWLLGQRITLTKLSPQELSLQPIRADALILLQSDQVLLHIEFQTDPDDDIPFRMADYRLRAFRRFPDKQMHQFVVYLRKTDSPKVYQTTFEIPNTFHQYQVIRLWEQPTQMFLQSPGLLPFAVLTQSANKAEVLRQVAQRVEAITERTQQSDVAASAAILAGLVLEKELIQRLIRKEIMRESVIYQEIRAEAKVEGREEKAREIALNLLNTGMAVEQVAFITGLSAEVVLQLQRTH
jgi:predicted transposase/invertase (TIGR01784 family)